MAFLARIQLCGIDTGSVSENYLKHMEKCMRKIGLGLSLCLLACGTDLSDEDGNGVADGILTPNNVSVITPTTPRGYVAGQILDANTKQPLSSANIRLFGGGIDVPLETDQDGYFQHGPVPSGSLYSVNVSKTGYTEATLTGIFINPSAGDFPLDNGGVFLGPISLIPSDGTVSVQVVSYTGQPISGAQVTVETSVAYYSSTSARGTTVSEGATDENGLATVAGLANLINLPPRQRTNTSFVVTVAPVDLDADGVFDLAGTVMTMGAGDVYERRAPSIVVLRAPQEEQALQIIASNVDRLVPGRNPQSPTVLAPDETIYIVFNQAVAGADSFLVELVDETGDNVIATTVSIGALGNVVQLGHDTRFAAGQEYNLRLLARTADGEIGSSLQVAAPFFGRGDPSEVVRVQGEFVDVNGDGRWGNSSDRFELRLSRPVGRAGSTGQTYTAELFLELDLNGTSTIGDARGELPRPGSNRPYPQPILLQSSEPLPPNGAGRSGFTRYLANHRQLLALPLAELEGPVAFEVRLSPSTNNGTLLVDPDGREAPARLEGTAALVSD